MRELAKMTSDAVVQFEHDREEVHWLSPPTSSSNMGRHEALKKRMERIEDHLEEREHFIHSYRRQVTVLICLLYMY